MPKVSDLEATVNDLLEKGKKRLAEVQAETEREIETALCEDYTQSVWTMYNAPTSA